MDRFMLFNTHIDVMTKKVMGTLVFLTRIQEIFTKETRILVVQSLVLSIINYCMLIWSPTTKEQILRVQRLQNFAAKVAIGGARKSDHVTPIFKELKWLNIEQKCRLESSSMVYKALHNYIPD